MFLSRFRPLFLGRQIRPVLKWSNQRAFCSKNKESSEPEDLFSQRIQLEEPAEHFAEFTEDVSNPQETPENPFLETSKIQENPFRATSETPEDPFLESSETLKNSFVETPVDEDLHSENLSQLDAGYPHEPQRQWIKLDYLPRYALRKDVERLLKKYNAPMAERLAPSYEFNYSTKSRTWFLMYPNKQTADEACAKVHDAPVSMWCINASRINQPRLDPHIFADGDCWVLVKNLKFNVSERDIRRLLLVNGGATRVELIRYLRDRKTNQFVGDVIAKLASPEEASIVTITLNRSRFQDRTIKILNLA